MALPRVRNHTEMVNAELTSVLENMPDPTGGGAVERLEQELAQTLGTAEVVAVCSGTAALHAALKACGIGPGDDVLVPALSVVMSVAPVHAVGAHPVFVDSNPMTFDLDYDDAAGKITGRTRAIIPVHLWGRMTDPTDLIEFATRHGLAVIEDAAQAIGTTRANQQAGTVGTAGCFSMKDGKILWSGEGGFMVTNRPDLAAYARAFRSHWQPAPPGQAPQSKLATNMRLAAPLATIALGNLQRLGSLIELRRAQTSHLLNALVHVPGLRAVTPPEHEECNGYAPLLQLDLPNPRAFAEHLARHGIPNSTGSFSLVPCDTRPAFGSVPTNPCRGAAEILDRTLAVIVTEHDTEPVLDRYASIITREALTWST